MASAVLGLVGGIIGSAVAGPVGGVIGSSLGSVAGAYVDAALYSPPGQSVQGPRMSDLAVQDATYGTALPIVVGSYRLSGTVVWSLPIEELATTKKTSVSSSSGGKGKKSSKQSVSSTTYTYYSTFAVAVCEGEIASIQRVWADSKLVFDASAQPALQLDQAGLLSHPNILLEIQTGQLTNSVADAIRVYTGSESQMPDQAIVAHKGPDEACAYRGTAYLVFDRLNLTDYGNCIPQISVEVSSGTVSTAPVVLSGSAASPSPADLISARPHSLANGAWATVGVSGGRFFARIHKLNSRGTAIVETSTIVGPAVALGGISRLSSALSPDGDLIAVTARQHSDGGGLPGGAHLCVYSQRLGDWLPGGSAVGGYWTGVYGDSTVWIGDACAATCTASIGAVPAKIWACWSVVRSANQVSFQGFSSHSLYGAGGGIGGEFLGAATYVGLTPTSSLIAMDSESGSNRCTRAIVATQGEDGISFGGPSLLIADHPHNRQNLESSEWVRVGGEALLMVSGYSREANPILLSIAPAGSGYTVVRQPWSPPSHLLAYPCLSYVGGGRIACYGRDTVDTSLPRYAEIHMPLGTFSVGIEPQALFGPLLQTAAFGACAVPGYIAAWATPTSLALVRRQAANPDVPLSQAVGIAMERLALLSPADYDLTALDGIMLHGYSISRPMSARAAIGPLQSYAPFDIVESGGILRACLRDGGNVITVPDLDGRAYDTSSGGSASPPPPYERVRLQQLDLPRDALVKFADVERDYQAGARRSLRGSESGQSSVNIELPIAMNTGRAQSVADQSLYAAWGQRESISISVSTRWLHLEPGDVIEHRGFRLRLTNAQVGQGIVQLTGVTLVPVAYGHEAIVPDGGFVGSRLRGTPPTALMLLDLPPLSDDDAGNIGLYAAALSGDSGWPGARLYLSDGGDYNEWQNLGLLATSGTAENALPPATDAYPDEASILTVRLPRGDLESVDQGDWLDGANLALVGNEIIQYRNAAMVAAGVYQLSGLLRGRRGTERAITGHTAGERFLVLDGAIQLGQLPSRDLGQPVSVAAATLGTTLSTAGTVTATPFAETIRPFAPVHLAAARDEAGSLAVTWIRRTRLPGSGEWLPYTDVMLDELYESYLVEVLRHDGSVARSVTVSSPAYTYTAGDQQADFGAVQSAVRIGVAQVSTAGAGAGHSATATL